MTYAIISPTVNTTESYKDTGVLGHWRYEDLQVLAEIFAQANAACVCEAKQDARGGSQDYLYSTKWGYLGTTWAGYEFQPDLLAPQKRYLDRDRLVMMADDTWPVPDLASQATNQTWLYCGADPLSAWSPYMHEDSRLSAAGTTQATYSMFGQALDLHAVPPELPAGMNRPFTPKAFTARSDVSALFQDATRWTGWTLWTLSWNEHFVRQGAYGQAFDQSWAGSLNQRTRRTLLQNGQSPYSDQTQTLMTGWSDDVLTHQEYWEKDSTNTYEAGGYDPDGYHHYEWESRVDDLDLGGQSNPSLERNVPVPSLGYSDCLSARSLVFVWQAVRRDITWRSGQGQTQDDTRTAWFAFKADFSKWGTWDFTDSGGNARGLCVRWTFPKTSIQQQITSIKGLMSWQIPTFDNTRQADSPGYVTSQSGQLDVYFRGCYTSQKAGFTERINRP